MERSARSGSPPATASPSPRRWAPRDTDVSPPLLAWASRPWHNIQESVLAIQRHWADCLRAGREPQTSGRDNLKTLALVEAAYAGAASLQRVDPDTL